MSFCTGEEREYPKEFCDALAQGIVRDYSDRKSKLSFLEIFSGPNAPLTMSVAEALGVDPPGVTQSLSHKKGVTTEFRSLSELGVATADPCSSPGLLPSEISAESSKTSQLPVESKYRLAAVESGRQPSYGKRTSLIPDGLNSPNHHFDLARTLKHPFLEEQIVKADHKVAIEVMKSKGASISGWRLKQLAKIKSLVASLKEDQLRENERASWTAKQLGVKPKTVAMRKLQTEFGLEDKRVPDALLYGLPILGRAEISPFFESFDIPPQISEAEFYGSMSKRHEELIERVKFMGQKGGKAVGEAIFQKTQKEVLSGTMGPARDYYSHFYKKYQGVFGVVPSFGLEQGVDENGHPKYRRIDDHSASANNMVAHRLQKVPMTMVDYVAVLVEYAFTVLSCKVKLATEDMKSAYRQVALLPDHVRFAITAVYNPSTGGVDLHEIYGQPFGAGHAVPNFCRVAEWMSRLLSRCFKLAIDHFFDDFFVVEPSITIQVATFCMRETFDALGLLLDAEKSQPPSEVVAILGVLFNTSSLQSQSIFTVEAKATRVVNLISVTDSILSKGSITPTICASIEVQLPLFHTFWESRKVLHNDVETHPVWKALLCRP